MGSCPTVSPLPSRRTAVCFLWRCPSGSGLAPLPRPGVTRRRVCVVPGLSSAPEGRRDCPTACTRGGIEPRARRVQRDVAARGREGEQEGGGLGAGGEATGGARSRRKIEAQDRGARSRREIAQAMARPGPGSAHRPLGHRAERKARGQIGRPRAQPRGGRAAGRGRGRARVEPQARRLIAGRTGFHPWKLA